ncbi:hypothetical protein HEK616_40800 [Streptomyces nigrescens]|uniref:Lipoprotein n=1 Tax=Streptomyces nigrescens TaxID=1920 RepID=A0ABM7ZW71_STRNI|nr:hypothetical protein [Streptomyces nigrescens]BDM70593.1 hypothetical protein HEK616_40800 [Streptomyces nigrescens]
MKPGHILAAVACILVAVALVVGCNASGGTYYPPSTHTVVHHYHHTTPRTTPKYRAPALKPAAPRVPSFSKGFRR